MSESSELDPGIEHLTELVGTLVQETRGVVDGIRSVGAEVTTVGGKVDKIGDSLEAHTRVEEKRFERIEADLKDARERISRLEQAALTGVAK